MTDQQHNQVPRGEIFSRAYLERGEALTDSDRFRTRLAGHFGHYVLDDRIRSDIAKTIKMQLGVEVPSYGYLRKLKHQQQHQLCDAGTSRFKQLRRSLAMCPVAGLCLS